MSLIPAGRKATTMPVIARSASPHALQSPRQWSALVPHREGLLLMLLGIALGALLAANLQTQQTLSVTQEDYPRQIATSTIDRLESEQADLKRTIAELRKTIADRQEQAAFDESNLAGITQALEGPKTASGMTAVKGPGIRLVLDDSALKSIPAGDDPAFYIIHEYQLRDVVNVLWSAGAEAIAINNERLVSTSSIYCVGSTILVNDTRLSAPYELRVIGDPQVLDEAIANPGNLKSLKTRVKAYGIQMKPVRQREVAVPAYNGSLVVKHSTPGSW